jgi:hypothetical protein
MLVEILFHMICISCSQDSNLVAMVTDAEFALFPVHEYRTVGPFISDPFSAGLLPQEQCK